MTGAESSLALWSLVTVQALGLTSAGLARLSAGSQQQRWFHRLFMGSFCLVGAATMLAVALGPAWMVSSGTVLTAMVLTAVWDFGQTSSSLLS